MSLSTPILTTSSEIDTRVDDCSATAVVMKDDAGKAQMMSVFLIMDLPPQDEQRGTPTNPIVGNFAACCARRERPRSRAAECGQQFPPSDGDCHTPLPCEVRKGNDTTPRACCPNGAAPGAGGAHAGHRRHRSGARSACPA